jgi:hypothetical protein
VPGALRLARRQLTRYILGLRGPWEGLKVSLVATYPHNTAFFIQHFESAGQAASWGPPLMRREGLPGLRPLASQVAACSRRLLVRGRDPRLPVRACGDRPLALTLTLRP